MSRTRKPSKCQACGHRGGTLTLTEVGFGNAEVDATAADCGVVLAAEWRCAGRLFDLDGPTACLRRMCAQSYR